MKVWRVENKDGVGPYSARWLHQEWIKEEHGSDTTLYPGLKRDFDCEDPSLLEDYIFGFKTKLQAYDWFGGWFGTLRAFGFELYEVEAVPETILEGKSGRQIVFKKQVS